MKKWSIFFVFLLWMPSVHAYSFSDFLDDAKDVAHTIGDGFKSAGEWLGDRFKDTKATQGIDYGVRLAALESAKAVATAVLTSTRFLTENTLKGTEETARLGVRLAEEFLDKVVQNAATGVLKGPAEASSAILEGAKQASVGVLSGGKWLVNQSLGQVDINCIHYDGNVQDLMRLKLGNVLVQGRVIQPFSVPMDLDLADPLSTVGSLAKSIGKIMEDALLSPFKSKVETTSGMPLAQTFASVEQGAKQAQEIEQKLKGLKAPAELDAAQMKLKEAQQRIAREKESIAAITLQAEASIKKASAMEYEKLLKFISRKGVNLTRETVLYRQVLGLKVIVQSPATPPKAQ